MIEKILAQIDENTLTKESVYFLNAHGIKLVSASKMKEIVQEVAKEYGKDTNVRSNWIPTAEMLFPRYGQKVLASVRTDVATHEVIITTYERQEYWHNGIITAWQPLPAPYQKGE